MKTLKFEGAFDAVLALNGQLPLEKFYEYMPEIPLICADGAAIQLLSEAVKIDYVVGDFDSLQTFDYKDNFNDSQLFQIDEQDTNDFEKCLKFALERNYKNILIIGFHGGELEHTLNNWSVFKRYSKIMNLCIYDCDRYGISIDKPFKANFDIDETISIIPQPKVKIQTEGLMWNLNGEYLELGVREGARNVAIAEKQVFNIQEGEIFLFCKRRLFDAPMFY